MEWTMSHTILVEVITIMCLTISVDIIRIIAALSFTSLFPKALSVPRSIKS